MREQRYEEPLLGKHAIKTFTVFQPWFGQTRKRVSIPRKSAQTASFHKRPRSRVDRETKPHVESESSDEFSGTLCCKSRR